MPPKRSGSKTAAAGVVGDASAGRRITRLRSRELGLEMADALGPVLKKRKVKKTTGGKALRPPLAADPTSRPRPWSPRVELPPYLTSGNSIDVMNWDIEFRRICALSGPADTDVDVPCTIRTEEEDPRTAMDVVSIADKAIVRKAARSVVGIVSRVPDGKEIMQCSGIIVDWNKTSKLATIVTCSAAVCYDGALVHPKPNLRILLPNNTNVEGQLLFFNARYNIALLEAMVDSPLEPANFGSCPNFGQKVFALARDHKASLFARHGSILFQEPPSFFVDKYWLSLSSEVALCGTGGPAIDEHGNVVGMTFGRLPYPDILSISILQTCIDMWRRHSRVARPFLGMELRAFNLLDVSHQDKIEQEHGITDGFIVDEVYTERLGIFKGDVIVSYNGRRDFILHMFEAYLLSLGWGFLESSDSSWTTDLELEIYDPVGRITRCVTFTLGFSDTSEKVLGLL